MMKRSAFLFLVVSAMACNDKSTHVADHNSNVPITEEVATNVENGGAATIVPIARVLVERRQVGEYRVEIWKEGESYGTDYDSITYALCKAASGKVADSLTMYQMKRFAGSGGGSYFSGQFTFLDDHTIKIVSDGGNEHVAKDLYSKDVLMALEDPREILMENDASADTAIYEITDRGTFESAKGYPKRTFISENYAGIWQFQDLPKSKLRLLRNAVYASYGLKFKSKDLQEHFATWPDYNPRFDNVDSMLSMKDRLLVAELLKLEKAADSK